MFKFFSRRDTIVTRGDAQAKLNKKVLTKGTFQRQMAELKKKIKVTVHVSFATLYISTYTDGNNNFNYVMSGTSFGIKKAEEIQRI